MVNNIKIIDSYLISKKEFKKYLLDYVHNNENYEVILKRSLISLILEWSTHNFLYKLNISRNRTKDVDLDYPQKWYYKIGYFFIGLISYIFIK
jgi:hypothetical protein